jgi:pSer/pThr/pTyr-binding forkhead associated (FHA) protein
VLVDLNSLNCTLVNGHAIEQAVTLRDGDEVQIGDTIMRVGRR